MPSLDPLQISDTQSFDAAYNIYDGLVTYRPTLSADEKKAGKSRTNIVPDLADHWDVSPDRRTQPPLTCGPVCAFTMGACWKPPTSKPPSSVWAI